MTYSLSLHQSSPGKDALPCVSQDANYERAGASMNANSALIGASQETGNLCKDANYAPPCVSQDANYALSYISKLAIMVFLILFAPSKSQGQKTFEKTYFPENSGYGAGVFADSNGYTFGGMLGYQGQYRPVLIKTDLNGDTLWTNISTEIDGDFLNGMTKTTDGFVFMNSGYNGEQKQDVFLTKVNDLGNVLWTEFTGRQNSDIGNQVIQTSDNGYLVAGSTNSLPGIVGPHPYDVYIIKTNADGESIYDLNIGREDYNDFAYSVIETADSCYVFVGASEDCGEHKTQVYTLKLNQDGDTIWTRHFGDSYHEYGYGIKASPDESYIITGVKNTGLPYNYTDIYLVKIDTNGNLLWEKSFDFDNHDSGWKLEVMDNGYLILGLSDSGLLFLKTDFDGEILWSGITELENYLGVINSVEKCVDSGYIITGRANHRLRMFKTDSSGCIHPVIYSIEGDENASIDDVLRYSMNSIRGESFQWYCGHGNIVSSGEEEWVDIYWEETCVDTICSVVANACGSDTMCFVVNVDTCVAPRLGSIYGEQYPIYYNGTIYDYHVEKIEGLEPVNYEWSTDMGFIIDGQGTDSVTIDWCGYGAGELVVVAENECGSYTTSMMIYLVWGDIMEEDHRSQIAAHPVPAVDELYIEIPEQYDNCHLEIFDLEGHPQSFGIRQAGINRLDLSSTPAGIYLLRITSGEETLTRKIVVQ